MSIINPFNDVERKQLPSQNNIAGQDNLSSVSSIAVGVGSQAFKGDSSGIWLGANKFEDAPFSVNMAGHVIATSADFSASGYTKINIFKQDGIPTSVSIGDLWIDTDDGNKMYRSASIGADAITVGEWESVQDEDIAQAISDAATAQGTADGKVTTFYQDGIPTSLAIGDLWVDTNDGNKLYRASIAGADEIAVGEWIEIQDEDIADAIASAGDAQSTADSKIITFFQDGIPTATDAGDLWVDTNDGNKLYRSTAKGDTTIEVGHWVAVDDTRKTKVFAQDGIPTSLAIGDLWYDTNDGNKPYVAESVGADAITAGEWVAVQDSKAADALLKAGTSQVLTGDISIGSSRLKMDGDNTRFMVNDGTNDRILIGYLLNGF